MQPLVSRRFAPETFHVIIGVLVLAGLALRLHDFSMPGTLLFDEFHFVENARNYLSGRADWNDHPPLGKLLIALSIRLFGDNSVAWRAPALSCGLLTIGFAGWAVARLFNDLRAGWLAAALLSADGFFISYSRVGMIDGYLVTCGAAAVLVATLRWRTWVAPLAGALVGLACSIKFSGIALLPIFVVALLLDAQLQFKKRAQLLVLMVGTAAVLYLAIYSLGLRLTGKAGSIDEVLSETLRLLKHHSSLTDMKNPLASSWPGWFLPMRPITIQLPAQGGIRALTTLGNLAIWWPAVALAMCLAAVVAWRGVRETLEAKAVVSWRPSAFVAAHGRAVLLLGLASFSFIAPWMLSRRDSYIYHFLPAYLFLVMLAAAFLGWVAQQRRIPALIYLAVVLVVFALYAPVWSFFPISLEAFESRLFLAGWRI